MSRRPKLITSRISDDKKTPTTCHRRPSQKNVRVAVQKALPVPRTKSKSVAVRPPENRGKIPRIPEKTDSSSTDSTNLSEKDKIANLVTLRKEIDEWKRQEKLRSRVNELLGKAGVDVDRLENNGIFTQSTDQRKFERKKYTAEREEPISEITFNNPETETARISMQSGKEDATAAVTWISLPPERSARTSLKTVADYLSETQDEVPMTQRNLTLSPETLDALDKAEKLAEDVETQLSQIHTNICISDVLIPERFEESRVAEERLYIRNIVTSMFETGKYSPKICLTLNEDNTKSNLPPPNVNVRYDSRKSPKELSKKSIHVSEQKYSNPAIKNCRMCKNSPEEQTEKCYPETRIGYVVNADELEKDLTQGKSEKLNVQKGPAISIKSDLSIQTAQVVDIQPCESLNQKQTEHSDNIAIYAFHHQSKVKDSSLTFVKEQSSEIRRDSERGIFHETPTVKENLEEKMLTKDQCTSPGLRSEYKTLLGLQNDTDSSQKRSVGALSILKPRIDQGDNFEDIPKSFEVTLEDLSLGEPAILNEVDSLLEYQRNFIRQVHVTTKQFDKFLAIRLSDDDSSMMEGSKNDQINVTQQKIQTTKINDKYRTTKNKKVISNDWPIRPCSRMNIFNKNATSDVPYNSLSSSTMHQLDESVENSIKNKQDFFDSKNTQTSEIVSREKKLNETKKVPKKKLLVTKEKSSTETSKEPSETSTISSSTDDSESLDHRQSVSQVEPKKFDTEISSNNSSSMQPSIHTETKSNTDFIENFKNGQSPKDNNLDVNTHHSKKELTLNEVSKSDHNKMLHKCIEKNKNFTGFEIEKNSIKVINTKEEGFKNNICIEKQNLSNNSALNSPSESKKHRHIEMKRNRDDLKNEESQSKMEKSVEKSPSDLEDGSLTTFSLIENVPEISLQVITESNNREHDDSLRLFHVSTFGQCDASVQTKEIEDEKSKDEESTELKIESKLSEARENLNFLMKSLSNNSRNSSCSNLESGQQANSVFSETSKNSNADIRVVPEILEDDSHEKNASRNTDKARFNASVQTTQEENVLAKSKMVSFLAENSNTVQESVQCEKMSVLKQLISCSITPHDENRRLFTSTVIESTPSNDFAGVKIFSESSSETHSEGEIRFSSSGSYSLGEIKKKPSRLKTSSNGSSNNRFTFDSATL